MSAEAIAFAVDRIVRGADPSDEVRNLMGRELKAEVHRPRAER